ncbi:NAD(P)-dependent dehydrogenase (short-subunit alcohol dehydrogenase family) [Sphingobium xenophagum]|uniref:NAD(P)-dependent dehydrogenase (Short-subunit alcohol dehydrogenase family) n=1 Tax=Sphingobium xenophagum TaxID=121428 RepID=A0ABU1X6Q4_SPHXE|nr:SDR family oxidoreductase [Sphingobium xenophagum]MDR7157266.1 NAD(P)-dependent dehydrogenase (short-subunit alcohol dehydrogenase family) [Sphingobium xenophagum]
MMGRLENRVAVVTGATQGIGKGIALRLASEGASIVFCSRNSELSEDVLAQIAARGAKGAYVQADLTQKEQAEHLISEAVARFGKLDILVNNAQSRTPPAPITERDDEDFRGLYEGGVMGSLWTMKAAFPHMRDAGGGRIVNFSSFSVSVGMPNKSDYNVAKAGIAALTRTAAQEWGRYGITVNAVCPAGANEAIQAFLDSNPEASSAITGEIPLGRLGDCENDIGAAVAGLVCDDTGFVTGHVLMLDGGAHLRPMRGAGKLPVKIAPVS